MQISPIAAEFIANGGFPVKHLSYSSIKQYMQDPRAFLRKYVRYEFDDTTSPAYMAGLAVHKALEIYFDTLIKTGEILSFHKVKEIALDHIARLMHEKAGKAFSLEIEKNGGTFAFPNFTKEVSDEEILKIRTEAEEKLRDIFSSGEITDETGAPIKLEWDALDAKISEIANSLIKWGKATEEVVNEWAIAAIENYFENEPKYGKPVVTERFETVIFQDENGLDMPIPLKVGVDRVDLIEDGKACEIIDYKTIDKFTEDEAEKTEYELQAAANYFAALVITWVTPRRMKYVEILKESPGHEYTKDPERKLLKDDLIAIAAEHGVEFAPKELVVWMKEKLIEAGVLTKKPGVKEYVIDFDERPDVIDFFLALYKGVLNMVSLSEIAGCYLPNIFERFGGLDSARDFKEFEATPRPKSPKIQKVTIAETPKDAEQKQEPEEIDTF